MSWNMIEMKSGTRFFTRDYDGHNLVVRRNLDGTYSGLCTDNLSIAFDGMETEAEAKRRIEEMIETVYGTAPDRPEITRRYEEIVNELMSMEKRIHEIAQMVAGLVIPRIDAIDQAPPKKIYSSKEASDALGMSKRTFLDNVRAGKIKFEKKGRNYFYSEDSLRQFLYDFHPNKTLEGNP